MAGIRDITEEQASTSETALSGDDPHQPFSMREMTTQRNVLEEIDIRMMDLQEVSFFTTQNGRPLPVIHGRVDFLISSDWKEQSRPDITFSSPQSSYTTITDTVPEEFDDRTYEYLPGTPASYFKSHGPLHPITMPQPPENAADPATATADGS